MTILKIIFLILIVLLASTIFVLGAFMSRSKGDSATDKNFRILLRVRLGCFLAMLILLLLIVVIT